MPIVSDALLDNLRNIVQTEFSTVINPGAVDGMLYLINHNYESLASGVYFEFIVPPNTDKSQTGNYRIYIDAGVLVWEDYDEDRVPQWEFVDQAGGILALEGRVEDLENTEYLYEIYENIIAGTAGTVTIPTNTTIQLNRYRDAGDCIITRVDGNSRPYDRAAREADGTVITSTLDAGGNYLLSNPSGTYPVSIVYTVKSAAIDIPNIPLTSIVNIYSVGGANQITVNIGSFTNNLTSNDYNVQLALNTIDTFPNGVFTEGDILHTDPTPSEFVIRNTDLDQDISVYVNNATVDTEVIKITSGGDVTYNYSLIVQNDFTVNGTTTSINTSTLNVEDKNIVLGNVGSPTDITADGGGITLLGDTNKTIIWDDANDNWTLNQNVNIPTGFVYKINNVQLASTDLGDTANIAYINVANIFTSTNTFPDIDIVDGGYVGIGVAAERIDFDGTNGYVNILGALVGINDAAPTYQLDVTGDINTTTVIRIGGVQVLSSTTLGSGVVNSSLTSVGALNSGSITSGFGSIDTGADNIITTGTIGASGAAIADGVTATTQAPLNNTTLIATTAYVDAVSSLWLRITGTPNYLIPNTAADDIGATGARITKGWFTNVDTGNVIISDDGYIGIGAALERIEFDATGYVNILDALVGIGVASPGTILDVNGTITIRDTDSIRSNLDTANILVSGGNATNTGANIALFGSTHATLANVTRFRSSSTGTMWILEDGSIGVGTPTPGAPFDVRYTQSHFGSSGGNFFIDNNTLNYAYTANSNSQGWINFTGYEGGATQFRDLIIGDGKQNQIAFFDGSTGNLNIVSGVLLYGGVDINTGGTLDNVAYKNQGNTFTLTNTFPNIVINEDGFVGRGSTLERIKFNGSADTINVIGITGFGIGTEIPNELVNIYGTSGATFLKVHDARSTIGDLAGIKLGTMLSSVSSRYPKTMIAHIETGGFGLGDLIFAVNGAVLDEEVTVSDERMRITSTGFVGIGTDTPNKVLDIVGEAVELGSNEIHNSVKFSRILSKHYSTAEEPTTVIMGASGDGYNSTFIGGGTSQANAATSIVFYTAANTITAVGTPRMILNSIGNFGVGTQTPDHLVDIEGLNATQLRVYRTNNFNSNMLYQNNSSFVYTGLGLNDSYYVSTNADMVAGALLTVTQGGQVGIGTTTPASPLEVSAAKNTSWISINTVVTGYEFDDIIGKLSFLDRDSSANLSKKENAFIRKKVTSAVINGGSGDQWQLEFGLARTAANAFPAVPRMIIDQFGNIGGRTTKAKGPLDISIYRDELVPNGTFVTNITGWNNLVSFQYDTFAWDDPKNSMHLATTAPITNVVVYSDDDIPLVDNVRYKVYVLYENASGTDFPTITIRDAVNGTIRFTFPAIDVTNTISTGYEAQFESEFTENVVIQIENTAGDTINFYINSISIQEVSPALLVSNAGNVGIGTSAPDDKLHVYSGDSGATPFASASTIIESNASVFLQFLTPNTQINGIMFGDPDQEISGYIRYSHLDDSMQLWTNNSTRITIDSLGLVGINDTTPSYQLDVNGDINTTTVYRVGGVQVLSSTTIGVSGATIADGVTATTQSAYDNSTLVATTAYVDNIAAVDMDQTAYVAKNGNDSTASVGSLNYPYLTIQAAINAITDATVNKKYVVKISPGDYTENIVAKNYVYFRGDSTSSFAVRVFGTNGTLLTFPDTGLVVENIAFRMSPTASGAIVFDATGGSGNFNVIDCSVEVSSSTNGITAKVAELDCDSFVFFDTNVRYQMTGSAVGSNDHNIIDITNTTEFRALGGLFVAVVNDVDDNVYLFRDDSTSFFFLIQNFIDIRILNASFSGKAVIIYNTKTAVGTDNFKRATINYFQVLGAGSGDGYNYYIETATDDCFFESRYTHSTINGFTNNYLAYVGDGDNLESTFSTYDAAQGIDPGNPTTGTVNLVFSPAGGDISISGSLNVNTNASFGGNVQISDTTAPGVELHNDSNAAADPNGTEANATTGWSPNNTTITSDSGSPQTGTYALKGVAGAPAQARINYRFPTVVGVKYLISIWAKRGVQGTDQYFYNWDGVTVSPDIAIDSTSWKEYVFEVIADDTEIAIKIYPIKTAGAAGDELFVDNVSISKSGGDLIVDGNVSADSVTVNAITTTSVVPPTISGFSPQNYSDLVGYSWGKVTADSNRNISGIVAQDDGYELLITNVGIVGTGTDFSIGIPHEAVLPDEANRIVLIAGSGTVSLSVNESIRLKYDGTISRWREISY